MDIPGNKILEAPASIEPEMCKQNRFENNPVQFWSKGRPGLPPEAFSATWNVENFTTTVHSTEFPFSNFLFCPFESVLTQKTPTFQVHSQSTGVFFLLPDGAAPVMRQRQA
jgi:hypothetical protein